MLDIGIQVLDLFDLLSVLTITPIKFDIINGQVFACQIAEYCAFLPLFMVALVKSISNSVPAL